MNVLVVDGQGGRVGQTIVEKLFASGCDCEITAVGTNALATAAMLKAGASAGATGENSVRVAARDADVIVGPLGILAANSLLGEITPGIALAISESAAQKILVPVNKCSITVAGATELPLNEAIAKAVEIVCTLAKEK